MIGLALALAAAYGAFLLYTAAAYGWRGVGLGPAVRVPGPRPDRLREMLVQAGLADTRLRDLAGAVAAVAVLGAALGFALFGGVMVPAAAGLVAASAPLLAVRSRRERRVEQAREAWPRMIEEIRLEATTMGRSIPSALLSVGLRGPAELRPAFEAAHREWLVSTDFVRTVAVLRERLADPTADVVCETLLVAHDVGGSDVSSRLVALAEDRVQDLHGRKDARAKQAGARFARWFVLAVPAGMALAGMSIGDGRAAYAEPVAQVWVVAAIAVMAVCWVWAGRIMRLPGEQRVLG